jgi:hypothetical protein
MKKTSNWLHQGLRRQRAAEPDSAAADVPSSGDTETVRTLTLEDGSAYGAEENVGFDPYNTGCFDVAKS